MSLTFALVVDGPAYGSQNARSAYQFAQAVIANGHRLQRVFFYQDGVHNGSALAAPASDEFDLLAAWQLLGREHQVELQTCVAAALRRGVVSELEASQHALPGHNLAAGFEQAGLGGLAEVLLSADRVIQF
ncbi:sulfurtransferase complex subunit TusD [Photobacterium sp. WH77]|uniref:Sulfurtransferase TusD homolog n=1 Tax=Photobacterium arenosum TaxID=2774143 RepID=A0ABR9BKW3_9GAMM|nr:MULTISPECIES: sulfurtransferase complex subunit TusD [Photobacterium]MBD8513180.1 sulfurtransferase complex subunit TusD [Photobacterium arenosum]MCG2837025.1 sulfurtransferase complex subunit TusD [Photobacterium sp. WH77]MCG2844825.1 sulfurtransferase complex subunit TusD [Photobacterium sp. WH80]MDO6580824.1 sulfurtransferase complex subunit TusD [Photobacterium sp. 2_MG-2023]